ncbi:hypothetical protein LSUE1_G002734 [Lachnellula suecica]|uniref:DUF6594 domain-containing protein n=1 Tax=Lachnellula suecica TaxID=602035 RepID=A0A8T9CQL5_9HELO|nr:hypothetical protein LSUE1_G002734 [Lachnellula suecica]
MNLDLEKGTVQSALLSNEGDIAPAMGGGGGLAELPIDTDECVYLQALKEKQKIVGTDPELESLTPKETKVTVPPSAEEEAEPQINATSPQQGPDHKKGPQIRQSPHSSRAAIDPDSFDGMLEALEADSALFYTPSHFHLKGGYALRMQPLEAVLGSMHLKNVLYLRSKVLKHRIIMRVGLPGRTEAAPEQARFLKEKEFKPRTAVQNYKAWIETATDPSLDQITGYIGQGEALAVLEYMMHDKSFPAPVVQLAHNQAVGMYNVLPKASRAMSDLVINARDRDRQTVFRIRLFIAGAAGLALIVPMLIVTLHPTKLTSLLTTSLFVVAVAVVLAWVMEDAQNKDIVAATAAYAAVLVVFVGTQ